MEAKALWWCSIWPNRIRFKMSPFGLRNSSVIRHLIIPSFLLATNLTWTTSEKSRVNKQQNLPNSCTYPTWKHRHWTRQMSKKLFFSWSTIFIREKHPNQLISHRMRPMIIHMRQGNLLKRPPRLSSMNPFVFRKRRNRGRRRKVAVVSFLRDLLPERSCAVFY